MHLLGRLLLLLALVGAVIGCSPAARSQAPTAAVSATPSVTVATAGRTLHDSATPLVIPSRTSTVRHDETPTVEPGPVAEYVFPGELLTINDLYFVDEDNGWGVGDMTNYNTTTQLISCCKPIIAHTTDGGKSWVEISIPVVSGLLESVVFTDTLHGYAVGVSFGAIWRALILRTADGGETWSSANVPDVDGQLNMVVFTSGGNGWSVGRDMGSSKSLMLRTSDGINWALQDHPSHMDAELSSMTFPTEDVGYAVGFVGHDSPEPYLLKTMDGGHTWIELTSPYLPGRLLDVLFEDELNGYAVGHYGVSGTIIKTQDGGATWSVEYLQGSEITLEWIFESRGTLTAVGNDCYIDKNRENVCGGQAWVSENAGDSWQSILSIDQEMVTAVSFLEPSQSMSFSTNLELPAQEGQPHALFYRTTFYRYVLPDGQ